MDSPGRLRRLFWLLAGFLAVFGWCNTASHAAVQESQLPPLPSLTSVPEPLIGKLDEPTRTLLEGARAEVAQALRSTESVNLDAAFSHLCLLYLRFELSESAAPCLAEMKARQPEDYRWPYYELLLADQTSDLESARRAMTEVRRLRPEDTTTILRSGDLYLALGQIEQAETDYQLALQLDPTSASARLGLGRVEFERGETEKAIELFRAALLHQPPGSILHHHLGMAYRDLGDLGAAKTELKLNLQVPVTREDPLADGLRDLGIKREELFDRAARSLKNESPEDALSTLRTLLELTPEDPEVHYSAARALVELSQFSEAEDHLKRALALDPQYGEAHFNLGLLLGRTGRGALAHPHFERASKIDPGNAKWRTAYAQVIAARGDFAAAMGELAALIELDRALTEPRRVLGAMAASLGQFEKAREQFAELVQLTPEDPQVHYGLALSLFQLGSYEQAATTLEAGVQRFPAELGLGHLLARLLATAPDPSMRDGERAVRLAEKIVRTQLTVDYAETLAMALAEVGRFQEAIVWQQRVLDQVAPTPDSASASGEVRKRLELYQAGQPFRAARPPSQ